jgi:hypothetical protein
MRRISLPALQRIFDMNVFVFGEMDEDILIIISDDIPYYEME